VIIIKAQKYRTQEKNREDAIERLAEIIKQVTVMQKVRRATKPGRAAKQRRLDTKALRSRTKALRSNVVE